MKVVNGIKMKDYRGTEIIGGGTVTDSGRYVVSAIGRFTGDNTWKKSSKKDSVAEFNIPLRFDVCVSEWTGDQQGDFVLPYLSMSMMLTRSPKAAGERDLLLGVDNESNKQYKQFVVSDEIFATIKAECTRAEDEAADLEISGQSHTIVQASLIKDSNKFSEAAKKANERRTAYAGLQAAAAASKTATEAAPTSAAGASLKALAEAGEQSPQA